MKNILISFFLCLSFVLSQERLDRIIAVVGSNIITEQDFVQQVLMVAQQRNINPSLMPLKYKELENAVLDNIINQYVFLEHAKLDTSIVIENVDVQNQIDRQIDSFVQSVGSVDSLESYFGKSLQNIKADYWQDVYDAMLVERFKYSLFSRVSVGHKEVSLFYEEYKDSLPPSPLRANFTLCNVEFYPSEKTYEEVYGVVMGLKDSLFSDNILFENLIKRHSDDSATSQSGGFVGFTERGSLLREYEEAAYSMNIDDVVGPIKTSAGYHLIKLLDKRGDKINTQHLLKIVNPTDQDKSETISSVLSLSEQASENPVFLEEYVEEFFEFLGPFSGSFENFIVGDLPDEIYNIIKKSEDSTLHDPIMLRNGSILIVYVYEKYNEEEASLENSYDFIKSLAQEKKTIEFLEEWLSTAKKSIYINIMI